jgi:hypothetical protein
MRRACVREQGLERGRRRKVDEVVGDGGVVREVLERASRVFSGWNFGRAPIRRGRGTHHVEKELDDGVGPLPISRTLAERSLEAGDEHAGEEREGDELEEDDPDVVRRHWEREGARRVDGCRGEGAAGQGKRGGEQDGQGRCEFPGRCRRAQGTR